MKNSTYIRVSPTVSTVKKSQASTPAAWERRNSAQLGPLRLGGRPQAMAPEDVAHGGGRHPHPELGAPLRRSAGSPNGGSPVPAAAPAPRAQDRGPSRRAARDGRSIDVGPVRDANATASPG